MGVNWQFWQTAGRREMIDWTWIRNFWFQAFSKDQACVGHSNCRSECFRFFDFSWCNKIQAFWMRKESHWRICPSWGTYFRLCLLYLWNKSIQYREPAHESNILNANFPIQCSNHSSLECCVVISVMEYEWQKILFFFHRSIYENPMGNLYSAILFFS